MNEEEFKKMFRFYMGRHKIFITDIQGNKSMIIHLEEGFVGNKTEGYKKVKFPDMDITVTRNCRYKKRD